MKRHIFAAGFTISSLFILGIAGSISAGEQVPFKGSLEGSFTPTVIDPAFPLELMVQLDGTGTATQLGEFSLDFPHFVTRSLDPSIPSTGMGIYTFTAANGDKLYADGTGKATLIAPGMLWGVENATITGGTGRFAGATGSFVVERLIDQFTLTTVGAFEGTISTPGAN